MNLLDPINPIPPIFVDGPTAAAGGLVWLLLKAGKAIKAWLTPPKDKESPEDVAERNRAFQMFCDRVNDEARQIEVYVIGQLDAYGKYLSTLNGSEEYSFLRRYKVNTRTLLWQLDFLKAQIPGIIGTEVSRRLSDTDAECLKIRRMLPGAEKEAKMQEFLSTIINSALEKCAQTTSAIMEQVQDLFIEDLQECLHTSRRQLDQTEAELAGLTESSGDTAERERICAQAKQVVECCELVLAILA